MIDLDHPGLDGDALTRLKSRIDRDIAAGDYDGAHIIVAHGGRVGLDEAVGFADRDTQRASAPTDLYRLLSLSKAFTNLVTLQAIDHGELSLSTKVVDVIPDFLGPDRFRRSRKDRINVFHLLTHRAGMPPTPTPVPYDELGDLDNVIAAISGLDVVTEPGTEVNYSPTVNHALLGEMVRRVRGASTYSQVVREHLFDPLGMSDTSIGARAADKERLVPLRAYIPEQGWLTRHDVEVMNEVIVEGAELPWVGGVSTAHDIHLLTEMLRRRGGVDGRQVISPAMLDLATRNHTGDVANNLYGGMAQVLGWDIPRAHFGLGFGLAGDTAPTFFGPLLSARAHGNYGAGSTLFWVDPELDLTFVCLTAGVMEESANVLRFQRLSQMAAAAVRTP